MPEKCILLEDTTAYKQTSTWGILMTTKEFTEEHIVRGSLLVTLTYGEVTEISLYFTPPLQYKKYSDDSIKLRCKPEQIFQLNDQQFNLLLGVKSPLDRYKAIKILNWAEKLKIGFGLNVSIPTVPHPVRGAIQYIGTLPDEEGTKFGIELLVSE